MPFFLQFLSFIDKEQVISSLGGDHHINMIQVGSRNLFDLRNKKNKRRRDNA
jgi:hypothetical protein